MKRLRWWAVKKLARHDTIIVNAHIVGAVVISSKGALVLNTKFEDAR